MSTLAEGLRAGQAKLGQACGCSVLVNVCAALRIGGDARPLLVGIMPLRYITLTNEKALMTTPKPLKVIKLSKNNPRKLG